MCHRTVSHCAILGAILALTSFTPARANFTLTPHPSKRAHHNHLHNVPFPLIAGFGNDIPLAFALRQIVPAGVLIVTAPSIDTHHIIVSWRGGVPWNTALETSLAAAGLSATITPVIVKIRLAKIP